MPLITMFNQTVDINLYAFHMTDTINIFFHETAVI